MKIFIKNIKSNDKNSGNNDVSSKCSYLWWEQSPFKLLVYPKYSRQKLLCKIFEKNAVFRSFSLNYVFELQGRLIMSGCWLCIARHL